MSIFQDLLAVKVLHLLSPWCDILWFLSKILSWITLTKLLLGNTPLLLTIGHHWTESTTMDFLLAAGADPCATNSNGETLLHRACKSLSNTNAATLLLAHNALPGCKQSSDGSTPIHWYANMLLLEIFLLDFDSPE